MLDGEEVSCVVGSLAKEQDSERRKNYVTRGVA